MLKLMANIKICSQQCRAARPLAAGVRNRFGGQGSAALHLIKGENI